VKCFEIQSFGIDGLKPAERPDPEPGVGEVRVRMSAYALNYRDLMMVRGHYDPRLALPRIPLSDGVGEVEAVGPGVEGVGVGDRVASCFFQRWAAGPLDRTAARSALGGEVDGVLADRVVLRAEGVVPAPAHLTDVEAAALPCAGLTAWTALVDGGLRPGETVLVLGTGGVSLFALQIAVGSGARVIATSSSDEKLARARELGAAHGINYAQTPAWEKEALELTDGVGVDHVVEVGGAGTLPRSLKAVRMGGHVALIGVLAGVGEFDPLPAVMKSIRLQGVLVGSRAGFEAFNRFVTLHELRPVLDETFPFDEAPAAYRHLESQAHVGKVTITAG